MIDGFRIAMAICIVVIVGTAWWFIVIGFGYAGHEWVHEMICPISDNYEFCPDE